MHTKLSDYRFDLPKKLIAQFPAEPRDSSRLMIVDRKSRTIKHSSFREITQFFAEGDQLILNDTKVIPARVIGTKFSGAKVELLLIKPITDTTWEVLARPARKLPPGTVIHFSPSFTGEVIEDRDQGMKVVKFESPVSLMETLLEQGKMPLPPYIRGGEESPSDKLSYQTVYAEHLGAVAAPTAGLHFTPELLGELEKQGVNIVSLTLHVGMGTFKPVVVEDIMNHPMHKEKYVISRGAADQLNQGYPETFQLCVGTTSCRAVESAVGERGVIQSGTFETSIFIYPGYHFQFTRALLTNFHLPESSLLMLVSAFGGYDLMREAYKIAVREEYRFYSYGDAMLII